MEDVLKIHYQAQVDPVECSDLQELRAWHSKTELAGVIVSISVRSPVHGLTNQLKAMLIYLSNTKAAE